MIKKNLWIHLIILFSFSSDICADDAFPTQQELVWLEESKDFMFYDVARAYCISKGARLPTEEEFLNEGETAEFSKFPYHGYWIEDEDFTYKQVGTTADGLQAMPTNWPYHGGVYARCVKKNVDFKLQDSIFISDLGSTHIELKTSYSYENDTNLIRKSFDYDNDGSLEYSIDYSYDAHDNLLSAKYYTNGFLTRTASFTYDTQDNLLSFAFDEDADGEDDSAEYYTYDTERNRISERWDSDERHFSSAENIFTYDSQSNRLTKTYRDGDSLIVSFETSAYDEKNNLISHAIDYDNNGVFDTVGTYEYSYDDNNILSKVFTDEYGSYEYIYTYNEDDKILSTYFNAYRESMSTTTYNPSNYKLSSSWDKDFDNIIDSNIVYTYTGNSQTLTINNEDTKTFTYDGYGNVLSYTLITLSDEEANVSIENTWEKVNNTSSVGAAIITYMLY